MAKQIQLMLRWSAGGLPHAKENVYVPRVVDGEFVKHRSSTSFKIELWS